VLTILDDDKKRVTVDGRIAAIVRWLIRCRNKIESLDKIHLTISCAGPKVNVETIEREQLDTAHLR